MKKPIKALGQKLLEKVATALEGETVTQPLNTDAHRAMRFGMMALLFGLGGFLLWAGLAPIDEGVTASGIVTVEGKRKTIQHLKGGIVEEIRVREGDAVKAGDVLVRLNDVEVRAQMDIVRSLYWSALAMETRLEAERLEQPKLVFPAELLAAKDDKRAQEAMHTQSQLFATRQTALRNELAILKENIDAQQEQMKGLSAIEQAKRQQIASLSAELESIRGLVKEGFVPRNKMFEMERTLAELTGSRGNDVASIARTQNAIAELKLRILQRKQDMQKEVQTQLGDVQKEVSSQRDRLKSLTEDFERAQIRSPSDGFVVGLNLHTIGGVVRPGEPIMDVVPHGETLVVEAQVMQNLIDKVHPGLKADVRFAFGSTSQVPVVDGIVKTVTADVLTDQRTGMPYYRAQVEVSKAGVERLAKEHLKIQPGMHADVIVKTGERTFLNYLLKPLLNRIAGSMKEV